MIEPGDPMVQSPAADASRDASGDAGLAAAGELFRSSVQLGDAAACERLADRIDELAAAQPGDAAIALELAKTLVNASNCAPDARGCARLADRVDHVAARFPDDERIAQCAAMAHFNTTSGSGGAAPNIAAVDAATARIGELLHRLSLIHI